MIRVAVTLIGVFVFVEVRTCSVFVAVTDGSGGVLVCVNVAVGEENGNIAVAVFGWERGVLVLVAVAG